MKQSLTAWVDDHDERWSFILLYVGGSVVLSIYAGLFWVAMLMLLHFLLEIWRQTLARAPVPLWQAMWEVKLDIALLLLAVNIALYAEVVIGALGAAHAARAGQALRGAQIATRFAIIEKSLRIFLLTMDDMTRVAGAIIRSIRGRKALESGPEAEDTSLPPATDIAASVQEDALYPWRNPGRGDKFAIIMGCFFLVMILLSPQLTAETMDAVMATIAAEFTP